MTSLREYSEAALSGKKKAGPFSGAGQAHFCSLRYSQPTKPSFLLRYVTVTFGSRFRHRADEVRSKIPWAKQFPHYLYEDRWCGKLSLTGTVVELRIMDRCFNTARIQVVMLETAGNLVD